jgi:hypothetical protein
MARLHYAGYPTRVALAVVIDRARTYLLRARVHKQNYERARIQAGGTGSNVILAIARRGTCSLKPNLCQGTDDLTSHLGLRVHQTLTEKTSNCGLSTPTNVHPKKTSG